MTLSGGVSVIDAAPVHPRSTAIVPVNKRSNQKQHKSTKVWNFIGHKLAGLTSVSRQKHRKLLEVVAKGNVAEVMDHLASTPNAVELSCKTSNGQSALHIAASRGYNQIVTLLLDRGADVNEQTNDGASALYLACENNREMAAKILLRHRARVNLSTQSGMQAIHAATKQGHSTIVELLLQNKAHYDAVVPGSQLTPLMMASLAGSSDLVEMLLDAGADPHAEDNEGNTPLHFSCREGHYRATYLLLTAGADPYMPNVHEDTAFEVAEANGHSHIAYLLETNGMGAAKSVHDMDRAFVQDERLSESLARNRPELAEIIVKNRLKYSKFYELGCLGEETAIDTFDVPVVETEF
ncbi:TPA: hypothetical protein N0F65_002967 [Lagenidium giganteum]|uniref:Ankyrin repeat protein n=1 Tax=Lagenidium giganteum TaxID=4803 RepID=A0AAV2YMQ4_9STRA|nr:TPA: hypothetical protein N0F65_002967 [Lagenidium giganteum]